MPTVIDISSVLGLTALGMFTAQILMGLLLSVGYNPIRQWPRQRWIKLFTFHNWLGYIGLATACIHPLILLWAPLKGGTARQQFEVVEYRIEQFVVLANATAEHLRRVQAPFLFPADDNREQREPVALKAANQLLHDVVRFALAARGGLLALRDVG